MDNISKTHEATTESLTNTRYSFSQLMLKIFVLHVVTAAYTMTILHRLKSCEKKQQLKTETNQLEK